MEPKQCDEMCKKQKKKPLSKVLQSGIIVGGTKNVNSFDFFCSYFPNK